MLRQIRATYARYGLSAAVRRTLYRMAQKLMVLDISKVVWVDAKSVGPFEPPQGFTFRQLTAAEVGRYAGSDPALGLDLELADRTMSGRDFCFAALSGDRLAAYGWFALGSIEAYHNRGNHPGTGVAVSYAEDVAFMYNGFTHPDFRGNRLHSAVKAFALQELAAHGVTKMLGTTDWTNYASRNSFRKLGCQDLGCTFRGGWGRCMLTLAPAAAKKRGIRFGSKAVVVGRKKLEGRRRKDE